MEYEYVTLDFTHTMRSIIIILFLEILNNTEIPKVL